MPAPSLAPSLAYQHGRLQRDQGLLPTFGPHPKLARAPQFREGRDSVTAYHLSTPRLKKTQGPWDDTPGDALPPVQVRLSLPIY